jgi:hypothetical protein
MKFVGALFDILRSTRMQNLTPVAIASRKTNYLRENALKLFEFLRKICAGLKIDDVQKFAHGLNDVSRQFHVICVNGDLKRCSERLRHVRYSMKDNSLDLYFAF